MAIKGKGKTRSRKSVAPAPRPQIVVRKPPIWRRAVTWIVVGALVLGAIGFGTWRWLHNRHAAALKSQAIAAVSEYANQVSSHYPADQKQLGGSTLLLFSSVRPELQKLAKDQVSSADAQTFAKNFGADAKKSADAIGALDVTKLVPDTIVTGETPAESAPGLTQLIMRDSQSEMVGAFKIYGSVASLMATAAKLPAGAERQAIITEATNLMDTADSLWQRGYSRILNVQTVLGIAPPPTSQLPQAPLPSPSPTATHHKSSPSPKASG